jgi:hypothetical protein
MSLDPQTLQELKARFQAEMDAYFTTKKAEARADVTAAITAGLASAGVPTPLTTQQAGQLLDTVKAKGVKSFTGFGLSVEFFPPVTP